MDVNIAAPTIASTLFFKHWSSMGKCGRIINISSIYSYIVPNERIYEKGFRKNILYGVSKAGLNAVSKYFAMIGAPHNIHSNTLLFGGVESNAQSEIFKKNYSRANPKGRLMNKGEIFEPIKFLLAEDNTYTNGAEIRVDGGHSIV